MEWYMTCLLTTVPYGMVYDLLTDHSTLWNGVLPVD